MNNILTGLRDELKIISLNNDFVLLGGGDGGGDSLWKWDTTNDLLSQEVTDLKTMN